MALPHTGDPIKELEHLAAEALVSDALSTLRFTKSGKYSDPSANDQGRVPRHDDRCIIPFGVQIDVDDVFAEPFYTMCNRGVLNYLPDRNTSLSGVYLCTCVSDDGTQIGKYLQGTSNTPIFPNVTSQFVVADKGIRDDAMRAFDPLDNLGALMCHGTMRMYGAQKTPFVQPTSAVKAGATTVSIPAVSGWNVGDMLMFPGLHPGETEYNYIAKFSSDGLTLFLATSLVHDHTSGDETAPVANMTRNVINTSAVTNDITRRGHVMQMHRQDAEFHNGLFLDLGRTDALRMHTLPQLTSFDPVTGAMGTLTPGTDSNTMGRYAGPHLHIRSGVTWSSQFMHVDGCVVMGTPGNPLPKHAYPQHGAGAILTNNIAANGRGSGLFGENGSELGAWRSNLVAAFRSAAAVEGIDGRDTMGRPPLPSDNGFQGVGYWATPLIERTDNQAFDCGFPEFTWNEAQPYDMDATAESYIPVGNLNPPSTLGMERPPQEDPLPWPSNLGFTAPAIDPTKLRIDHLAFYVARCRYVGCDHGVGVYSGGKPNIFKDCDIFACGNGFEPTYASNLHLLNCRIRAKDATVPGYPGGNGIQGGNQTATSWTISGGENSQFVSGLTVPWHGDHLIENYAFDNQNDLTVPFPWAGSLTINNTVFSDAMPPTMLAGSKQTKIHLENDASYVGSQRSNITLASIFAPFRMQIDGVDIIHSCRLPGFIPWPNPITPNYYDWNPAYIGLTNLQLFQQFGKWIGGYQVPDQTFSTHPSVIGGQIGVLGPIVGPAPPVIAPVAAFSASPVSGAAPLAVQFTDQSTNVPTSWAWNFGDGNTSTAQNPSHQYAAAGTYTVSLTATNSGGSNAVTKTGLIVVSVPMVTVPDLVTALNAAEQAAYTQATAAANAAGVPVILPAPHVYTQSPSAGVSVPIGTKITVQ